jgi:hypothetical protein
VVDPFPCVFGDELVFGETFGREAAQSVNRRLSDNQSARQLLTARGSE